MFSLNLLAEMTVDSLVKATEKLDTDDLADIVPNMPESAVHSLLLTLDFKHRERLNQDSELSRRIQLVV